jgi:hypothetical protein
MVNSYSQLPFLMWNVDLGTSEGVFRVEPYYIRDLKFPKDQFG